MKTEILKVTGMTCGGCVNSLTRALKAVNGVQEVHITLASGETSVHYDENTTSPDQLKSAVLDAGFGVEVDSTPIQ